MKIKNYKRYRKFIYGFIGSIFLLWGCSADKNAATADSGNSSEETQNAVAETEPAEREIKEASEEEAISQRVKPVSSQEAIQEPELLEADWSAYFEGLNGAAVLYDADASRYLIYNKELANTRRSPCSTFKIISSMIAMENGILKPEDSTRAWSGEIFWNESWNQDIAFAEAFRASCVWYFREVIDEMGPEMVQEGLDQLAYGNCDISDWEGRLNRNNNNRALTGFWVESSLKISPKEQAEVMERIFGPDSVCSEETLDALKQVMLVLEPEETVVPIYGKTGMGKVEGIVVDAWFTGFAERGDGNVYFCVYLGQTEEGDVSSVAAREIAVRIVEEYCK